MSNMSYCAIENVLNEVRELIDYIYEDKKNEVNEYELESAEQLINSELDELKSLLEDNINRWKRQNR